MRAITTTTAILPISVASRITRSNAAPAPRRPVLGRLFPRRREPSLFHRCLAVHIATAGTLSALR